MDCFPLLLTPYALSLCSRSILPSGAFYSEFYLERGYTPHGHNLSFLESGKSGCTFSPCLVRFHGRETRPERIRFPLSPVNTSNWWPCKVYILLWLFLSGSIFALLLIDSQKFSENLIISTFMFTLFIYLLFLIEDLDNPFQYDGRSSVDVNTVLLVDVYTKLGRGERI